MRPRDVPESRRIGLALDSFHASVSPLPGIQNPARRDVFLEQVMESIHRVRYVGRVLERDISTDRANPASDLFDPIKAAAFHHRHGSHDEACWLVFLSVQFGKSSQSGWRLPRDIYGALGGENHWDWSQISRGPARFRTWLAASQHTLKNDGVIRRFGNHRKYESLVGQGTRGTGAAFESYVNWIGPPANHSILFQQAAIDGKNDPRLAFDILFRSMGAVVSFGRTARFDYLTMIGKLGLAPIEPGSAYLGGATGPYRGASLLFLGSQTASVTSVRQFDARLIELNKQLKVGMQVLEDSLCNWQKSPDRFVRFRG